MYTPSYWYINDNYFMSNMKLCHKYSVIADVHMKQIYFYKNSIKVVEIIVRVKIVFDTRRKKFLFVSILKMSALLKP